MRQGAMRIRRWWLGYTVVALFGLLTWSSWNQSPIGAWIVYGFWGVVFISVVVRAMRPRAQGRRLQSGAGPAVQGMDEVQNMYLGRPDVGPTVYGSTGPPTTELTLDRTEPDPGDLRGVPREG